MIFDNKTLIGFLAISDGGIVLHHFDKEIFEFKDDYLSNLAKLIYPILNRHNIYSIVGDYCGTDFLRKTMEKKKKPKIQIPYTLMIYDKTKKEDLSELSNDFMLKKCTKEDTDFLFGLQAAYDMVEVLPPGEKFNPDNCRLNLRHNLGCQYIIGIQDKSDNKFVAKERQYCWWCNIDV